MDLSSNEENIDPEEIIEKEKQMIIGNLMPVKSCAQYEKVYNSFIQWKEKNNAQVINEDVLLMYFKELSEKWKPTTLWSHWSKLRTLKNSISMNNYHYLKTFVKQQSKGYQPKKSLILSWQYIEKFINISDHHIYFHNKVMLIFGVFGALRCQEIINIMTDDVIDAIDSLFFLTLGKFQLK
ncbi:hypothetical protein TKK_0014090 [Trichogramma kaykai]|uniref:Integrase SAM-like N-terminal domain-containing protein n=1 Tax=Trichogramma kaykai TaxID=54128 RepID=A0ABD2WFU4_9HYME